MALKLMFCKAVCKDGILVAETEDGKINQVQNEEEMVKEEKKEEDKPSFSKESSDSVENCPKNVQQADGMPNRSSGAAPELQIEEDKGAVILIPLGDNRVDDGKSASSSLACKYKITSSCCLSFEGLYFSMLYSPTCMFPFFAATANVYITLVSSCGQTVMWEDYERGGLFFISVFLLYLIRLTE